LDLLYNEVLLRQERGETPSLDEYLGRFPHLAEPVGLLFEVDRCLEPDPFLPATLRGAAAVPTRAAVLPSVPGYEVLGELGRGGMGVVYLARQARPQRLVALKMILAGQHTGPEAVARFLREAEAVACVQHPNIVQIYEVGEEEGRPYLALEYV